MAAALAVVAFVAFAAAPALAAPAPPFAELLRLAAPAAPRLAEGVAQVRAAQGLARQAAAPPNPTLEYQSENLGLRDRESAIQPRQDTLSLSQPLELGGKRPARAAAGRAELSAAEARLRQAEADFAADLALAYASAETAIRRAALLREDLGRAREDARAVAALVAAGKEAEVRAGQAEAAAAVAQADLAGAEADISEALARLSSLAGADTPFTDLAGSLLDAAGALPDPAPEPPADPPALQVARAERDAAARRAEVERVRALPDVTVSLGARRYQGVGATGVVAGVSAPLPLFDRNRGAVAAAAGQVAAADARLRGVRLSAQADWRAAAAQARAGRSRLEAADVAQTAAAENYRLTRIGYEAGKMSLFELLSARRALVDAQSRVLEARFGRVRAETVLARLAGRPPFGGAA